jgi:hypothetical protein
MPATGDQRADPAGPDGFGCCSKLVSDLRPAYLPPDPASRTAYVAGEIAQCVWFPPIEVPVGFGQTRTAKQLPVLTMVCGHSRWLSGLLLPTRAAADLFAGWWRHVDALGAVPRCWCGTAQVGRFGDFGVRSALPCSSQTAFRVTDRSPASSMPAIVRRTRGLGVP